MKVLKFLVRYEGLDGNKDCERVYTFDEMLYGEHEAFCFDYSGKVEKLVYRIDEIQPFNFDGWTKVEDELPGNYWPCLCWDGETMFIGYLSYNEKWIPYLSKYTDLSDEMKAGSGEIDLPVTHYMLLPNKPEHEN